MRTRCSWCGKRSARVLTIPVDSLETGVVQQEVFLADMAQNADTVNDDGFYRITTFCSVECVESELFFQERMDKD